MPKRSKATTKKSTVAKNSASTLDEERKKVLKKARIHIRPFNIGRQKMLGLTATLLVVLILGFTAAVSYFIYAKHSTSTLVYRVARVVPFPVARLDGRFVSYADYLFEVRYRKNLYEHPPASGGQQPVDFSSDDGKKLLITIENEALTQAKTKAVIKHLAAGKNVNVSNDELNTAIDEIIKSQGGEQKFRDAIKQFYGWDINDFRKELRVQLLQQKLELAILPGVSEAQHKKAESLRKQAVKGANFAKLAKANSQDSGTKNSGGDLGFISEQTPFVQEFKDAALKLKPGQVSEIIQTKFGFHIIKATGKKGKEVKVSHILINYAKDIETIIKEHLEEAKAHNYIKLPKPENT